MSVEAVCMAFDIVDIEPLNKFVLVVLGDVTNQDFLVRVNPEYISANTCIPVPQVKKILNELVRDGYLLRTAETHPSDPSVKMWRLNCDLEGCEDEF